MKRLMIAALASTAVLAGIAHNPAAAEPMPSAAFRTCAQLRAEYAAGIAKNAKAARRAVKAGFKRPLVCKRVYLQVGASLDPNRNGVACEVR